jgi:V8-like Glu-specific endopeptidase
MRKSILLLALACNQPPPPTEESSAIVNGALDYGDPAVGYISTGCSAALIGRRTILTAAHCVASEGERIEFCNCTGAGQSTAGCGPCMWGTGHIYPYFDHRYGNDYDDPAHDAAVIALDGDFPATFGVVPLRIGTAPSENASIRLVGYGYDGAGGSGYKRTGNNTISDTSSDTFDYDDTSQAYGQFGDSGSPVLYSASDCEVGVYVAMTATNILNLFSVDWDYTSTRIDNKMWWIQSWDTSVLGCGQTNCGDGFCQSPESCFSCPTDCGACNPANPCAGQPDGTDCGDDCCTGFMKCQGGVCTNGSCCNTRNCCLL